MVAMTVLAISHHGGVRLAELAFLLGLIGGVALALSLLPQLKPKYLTIAAGTAFAVCFLLLIIATHWGHFS
jgi:hypothetical protein